MASVAIRSLTALTIAIFVGGALAGCLQPPAGGPTTAECKKGAAAENLKVGTLLPITGALAAFGTDMQRSVDLAAQQINAAGGVNGKQVQVIHADSKTSPTEAPTAFNGLVNQGVVAVVGAASSGVTGSILDSAIQNKVVVVTPASTSPGLTNATRGDNSGYFYRVPPSDALQGKVLAKLVKDDNRTTANILAVNNAYGQGLAKQFRDTYTALGGQVQKETVFFDEGATTFASQVLQAAPATGGPQAVILIAYPTQGSAIMKEASATGATQRAFWYFSEGLFDQAFIDGAGKDPQGRSVVEGFKGTTPQATNNSQTQKFIADYRAKYPADTNGPGLFSAESYDALMAIALAAQCGGDNTSTAIKSKMRTTYNAPGTAVSITNVGAAFNASGSGDVNYQGASGDFDWDALGDPTTGVYSYWTVENGKLKTTRTGLTPS